MVIQGSNSRSLLDVGQAYANAMGLELQRYELSDPRACQLLVVGHMNSFWAVPAPEAFSRHSGTCRMLGDRNHQAIVQKLSVGDVLRVGSVGLVVTEMHGGTEDTHFSLSDETIDKLVKDTANVVNVDSLQTEVEDDARTPKAMDTSSDLHFGDTVSDQGTSCSDTASIVGKMCYMCFDDEETPEDPLVSPCKCAGDTKYVHINCLRKWHFSGNESEICSVSSVMASCSVCKSAYRSSLKLPNGKIAKIFQNDLKPPFISFLVVTKHEMAKQLFNTRFQLSFNTVLNPSTGNSTRDLQIGRSSTSDMMLDYRTVSAHHALVRFKDGKFLFIDSRSSNGSYLYLRRPVELTQHSTTNLRLGRTLLSLRVQQRGWNDRIIRNFSKRSSRSSNSLPSDSGLIAPNTEGHMKLIERLAKPFHPGSKADDDFDLSRFIFAEPHEQIDGEPSAFMGGEELRQHADGGLDSSHHEDQDSSSHHMSENHIQRRQTMITEEQVINDEAQDFFNQEAGNGEGKYGDHDEEEDEALPVSSYADEASGSFMSSPLYHDGKTPSNEGEEEVAGEEWNVSAEPYATPNV